MGILSSVMSHRNRRFSLGHPGKNEVALPNLKTFQLKKKKGNASLILFFNSFLTGNQFIKLMKILHIVLDQCTDVSFFAALDEANIAYGAPIQFSTGTDFSKSHPRRQNFQEWHALERLRQGGRGMD